MMPFIPLNPEEEKIYKRPCSDPSHNPPNMMYLPPGPYKWQCPSCGETVTFYVGGATCQHKETSFDTPKATCCVVKNDNMVSSM